MVPGSLLGGCILVPGSSLLIFCKYVCSELRWGCSPCVSLPGARLRYMDDSLTSHVHRALFSEGVSGDDCRVGIRYAWCLLVNGIFQTGKFAFNLRSLIWHHDVCGLVTVHQYNDAAGKGISNFMGFLSGNRKVKDTQSTHAKQECRGVWSVLNSNWGDVPQAIWKWATLVDIPSWYRSWLPLKILKTRSILDSGFSFFLFVFMAWFCPGWVYVSGADLRTSFCKVPRWRHCGWSGDRGALPSPGCTYADNPSVPKRGQSIGFLSIPTCSALFSWEMETFFFIHQ